MPGYHARKYISANHLGASPSGAIHQPISADLAGYLPVYCSLRMT